MTSNATFASAGPGGVALIPPPVVIVSRLAELQRETDLLRRLLAVSRDAVEQRPSIISHDTKAVAHAN